MPEKEVVYPTPEWIEEVHKVWHSDPENPKKFARMAGRILCYRVYANPRIGLDEDLYLWNKFEDGNLVESRLVSAEEAKKATWVVSASYEVWRDIISGKDKFVGDLMLGKVKIDSGDASTLIPLGPLAVLLAAIFNKVKSVYPDSFSPDELEKFRQKVRGFRERLGV